MSDRVLKVAVVLKELPEDQAAMLLRRITPKIAGLLNERRNEISSLSAASRHVCLQEFISALNQPANSLQELTPNQIVALVRDEHPQVIASVLAQQSIQRTQIILSALPVDVRLDVTDRLRFLGPIDSSIIAEIEEVLCNKTRNARSIAA